MVSAMGLATSSKSDKLSRRTYVRAAVRKNAEQIKELDNNISGLQGQQQTLEGQSADLQKQKEREVGRARSDERE